MYLQLIYSVSELKVSQYTDNMLECENEKLCLNSSKVLHIQLLQWFKPSITPCMNLQNRDWFDFAMENRLWSISREMDCQLSDDWIFNVKKVFTPGSVIRVNSNTFVYSKKN